MAGVNERFEQARRRVVDMKNQSRLMDNRLGEHSPIDSNRLPNMPRGSAVIIADNVQDIMRLIQEITTKSKKEIPFILYGKNEGKIVFFDQIDVELDELSGIEADFSGLMPKLQDFINKSKKDGNDIVAHGHSHPEVGQYYNSFSLGDMNAYKSMRFDNDVFNSKKVELCSCLLTGGNVNFLFFDGNDYYKFNDVFVQNAEGDIIKKLPCYGNSMQTNRGLERD